MKSVLVFCCLLSVVGLSLARPQEKYTSRFDGIDIHQILQNRRLLVPYLHCVLEKGKCTPEGKELRSHIRDALENQCAKCTQAQLDGTRLVIGHLINHEQEYWEKLKAKYDETGRFTKKYEQELRTVQN